MSKVALLLFLGTSLSAATLFRVACGGQGGSDLSGVVWNPDQHFTGGSSWSNSNLLDNPYKNLRFSTSFSYTFAAPVGNYEVTFKFLEPNKTSISQRIFNVTANGQPLLTNVDVFKLAGAPNMPVSLKVGFGTSQPGIKFVFTGVVGNAIISGIQLDSVDVSAVSTCLVCYQDTIDHTQLTSETFEQEIPIFLHMDARFLYFKVTFENITRFLGHTTLQASMGRPGTNHDELIGAYFDLTSPDGYFWQATPGSPQLHDYYDIVVYLKSTGSPINNATTGKLGWQICGFLPLVEQKQ